MHAVNYFVNMFELKQYNEELFVAYKKPLYSTYSLLPDEWQKRMADLAFMTGRVKDAAAIEPQTLPIQTLQLLAGFDVYMMSLSCAYRKIPGSCKTVYLRDDKKLWTSLSTAIIIDAVFAKNAIQPKHIQDSVLDKRVHTYTHDLETIALHSNPCLVQYTRYWECYRDASIPGYDKYYPNPYANQLYQALDAVYNPRASVVNMFELYTNLVEWITMQYVDDDEVAELRADTNEAFCTFHHTVKNTVEGALRCEGTHV